MAVGGQGAKAILWGLRAHREVLYTLIHERDHMQLTLILSARRGSPTEGMKQV